MRSDVAAYFDRLGEVPGWFSVDDFLLFDWLLARDEAGDLLEIGAFQGASAVLIGLHRRGEERFTVCDIFGLPETENDRTETELYQGLTRETFEANYRAFVRELPAIIQASSLTILDHVAAGSCRFVHVDGCHLYEYARADIAAARTLLNAGGVLACDDWRSAHTPGVTTAVLEQVVTGDLYPIAVTEAKFYGTWNGPLAAQLRDEVRTWGGSIPDMCVDLQPLRGMSVPRLYPSQPRSELYPLRTRPEPPLTTRQLLRALPGALARSVRYRVNRV